MSLWGQWLLFYFCFLAGSTTFKVPIFAPTVTGDGHFSGDYLNTTWGLCTVCIWSSVPACLTWIIILLCILWCSYWCFCVSCGKLCLEQLRWLTKVKRFSVAVMFLSKKEKESKLNMAQTIQTVPWQLRPKWLLTKLLRNARVKIFNGTSSLSFSLSLFLFLAIYSAGL